MKSRTSICFVLLILLLLPLSSLYAVPHNLPRVNLTLDIPEPLIATAEDLTYTPYVTQTYPTNTQTPTIYPLMSARSADANATAATADGSSLSLNISTIFSTTTSADLFPNAYSINQRNQNAKDAMTLIGADPATYGSDVYMTFFAAFPFITGEIHSTQSNSSQAQTLYFRYYTLAVENNLVTFLFTQDEPFTEATLRTVYSVLNSVHYTYPPEGYVPGYGAGAGTYQPGTYAPGTYPPQQSYQQNSQQSPQPNYQPNYPGTSYLGTGYNTHQENPYAPGIYPPGSISSGSYPLLTFTDISNGTSFQIPSNFTVVESTPTSITLYDPAQNITLSYSSRDVYELLPYYTRAIFNRWDVNFQFFEPNDIARNENVPNYMVTWRFTGNSEHYAVQHLATGYPPFTSDTLTYITYRNGFELRFSYVCPHNRWNYTFMDRFLSNVRFP